MQLNLLPISLTSFTTIIGFLALNSNDSPPFKDFGNMVALGVAAAWILSLTLLPILLSLFPINPRFGKSGSNGAYDKIATFVIAPKTHHHPHFYMPHYFLAIQIPRITIDDSFVDYFDNRVEFRRHTDFVTDNLTGIYVIQFDVKSAGRNGITDPAYLKRLEAFTQWAKQQPNVLHTSSFSTVMKKINRSMNGDDDQFYKVPDQSDLAAQYLLLYEMSLPFGLDLNNQVDIDKSSTQFVVTLQDVTTEEALEFGSRAENWLKTNTPASMHAMASGPIIMFSHIGIRSIKGMIKGTALAFVLITIVLIIALRSVRYGLLSIIPNILPATLTFGLWYFLFDKAGQVVAIVASVTLGIVVDDTIHFLVKYVKYHRSEGQNAEASVRYAFNMVGRALFATSFILAIGFATLTASSFKMNKTLGLLSLMTITIALIADFLLLPAILLLLDRNDHKKKAIGDTQ